MEKIRGGRRERGGHRVNKNLQSTASGHCLIQIEGSTQFHVEESANEFLHRRYASWPANDLNRMDVISL